MEEAAAAPLAQSRSSSPFFSESLPLARHPQPVCPRPLPLLPFYPVGWRNYAKNVQLVNRAEAYRQETETAACLQWGEGRQRRNRLPPSPTGMYISPSARVWVCSQENGKKEDGWMDGRGQL